MKNAGDSSRECIINETAWKSFGWKDPIGKHLNNNAYEVVGVVKDFHQSSVHEPIEPYFLVLHTGNVKGENIYSIRVRPDNINLARKEATETFERYLPDDAFEFEFLADRLYHNTAYKIWDGVNKTFRFFTALAVLISVMGLFGLISYTAKRRTKEMGIRKVFGSGPAQIYAILAREFVPLMLVAIILGSIGAYILYIYLPGAYKYQLQFTEFAIAWIVTAMIALLTISYHALQVALRNPVDSLRYE